MPYMTDMDAWAGRVDTADGEAGRTARTAARIVYEMASISR
jgi:hypothetical protein